MYSYIFNWEDFNFLLTLQNSWKEQEGTFRKPDRSTDLQGVQGWQGWQGKLELEQQLLCHQLRAEAPCFGQLRSLLLSSWVCKKQTSLIY